GGMGERSTLPLVGELADEWNLTTASAEVVRQRSTLLATLCAERGRDPMEIRRSLAVGYLIGRDAAELRERSRRLQAWVPPLAEGDIGGVPGKTSGMGRLGGKPGQGGGAERAAGNAGPETHTLCAPRPRDRG